MRGGATCPACGESDRRPVLERHSVPVQCNRLCRSAEEARAVPRGNLSLVSCRACGLLYNAAFDGSLIEYSTAYENAQHFSPRFAAYLDALAARLVETHGLEGKEIMEIGCGDGHFLKTLCVAAGARGRGFDPAAPLEGPLAEAPQVALSRRVFDAGASGSADFVCCRHVMEHLDQPREFLCGLREVMLRRRGAHAYVEVPDARGMIESCGIWDLLYEHVCYFTGSSLRRLLEGCGFKVLSLVSTFEGQFLGADVACSDQARAAARGSWEEESISEGDRWWGALRRFAGSYDAAVTRWDERLRQACRAGRQAAVWGAGTKGVMFLNVLDEAAGVAAVVDVNPRKQGCHVSGTGHPIIAPEELRSRGVDLVLVMNAAYVEEVRGRLAGMDMTVEIEVV